MEDENARKQLVQDAHVALNHASRDKVLHHVKSYYWSGMKLTIDETVSFIL